jgi:mono/diheme cytochrome c family protein
MGRRGLACWGAIALLAWLDPGLLRADAHEDYVLHCMGCHGPTGAGVPGKVPPLVRSTVRFMRSAEGRDYLMRVPGASNAAISDAQLSAVLNWVAENFGAGEFDPTVARFTPAEVAAHRPVPMPDVLARRTAIIASLESTGLAPARNY